MADRVINGLPAGNPNSAPLKGTGASGINSPEWAGSGPGGGAASGRYIAKMENKKRATRYTKIKVLRDIQEKKKAAIALKKKTQTILDTIPKGTDI